MDFRETAEGKREQLLESHKALSGNGRNPKLEVEVTALDGLCNILERDTDALITESELMGTYHEEQTSKDYPLYQGKRSSSRTAGDSPYSKMNSRYDGLLFLFVFDEQGNRVWILNYEIKFDRS